MTSACDGFTLSRRHQATCHLQLQLMAYAEICTGAGFKVVSRNAW